MTFIVESHDIADGRPLSRTHLYQRLRRRRRQPLAAPARARVGAEYRVTSCDLRVFV
jgi:hypothetical protein